MKIVVRYEDFIFAMRFMLVETPSMATAETAYVAEGPKVQ